jgi:hypothetical protein
VGFSAVSVIAHRAQGPSLTCVLLKWLYFASGSNLSSKANTSQERSLAILTIQGS